MACRKDVPAPIKAEGPPITTQEADTFGAALATAMSGCTADQIDALIDLPAFRERSRVAGGAAAARALTPTTESGTLGTAVCSGFGDDFTVRYVGAAEVDGAVRPRIRTIVRGGFNFLEPVLERRAGGTVMAVDLYSFRNGETFSSMLALIPRFQNHHAGTIAARAFQSSTQLGAQGKWAEAYEQFLKIPVELRTKLKAIALQGIALASELDEPTYFAAIAEFKKSFPGDPVTDLVELDAHWLRKDYSAASKVLTSIMKRTDNDPYVRTLRGGAYREAGDLVSAKADLELALKDEPELIEAGNTLLEIANAANDHAESVRVLRQLVAGGLTRDALGQAIAEDPRYAGLLGSAEYSAWLAETP